MNKIEPNIIIDHNPNIKTTSKINTISEKEDIPEWMDKSYEFIDRSLYKILAFSFILPIVIMIGITISVCYSK